MHLNIPILPDKLRRKIRELSDEGYSTIDIFDLVLDESNQYVDSQEQLSRCITSIISKHIGKRKTNSTKNEVKLHEREIPKIKPFDSIPHLERIDSLSKHMNNKRFEDACEDIALDILQNYEEFRNIETANNVSQFTNSPFDFFGFKGKKPYIIEFKGSLYSFNSPGETQKRRLKELLDRIEGLNIALLQVRLKSSAYRIFYNAEMDLFFDGKQMPLEPIEKWLRQRIDNQEKF